MNFSCGYIIIHGLSCEKSYEYELNVIFTDADILDVCKHPMISQPSGYIISPGYPQKYPPSANCDVEFHTTPREDTRIEILDIELESRVARGCFDWLILREANVTWMKHDYCGNALTIRESRVLDFDKLKIHFSTDGMNNYRGFLIKFECKYFVIFACTKLLKNYFYVPS